MATYRLSRLRRGASPVSSSATAGLAQKISTQKQTAIARDQIERVDYRPSGKSRVTRETTTKVTDSVGDPKAVIPSPHPDTPGSTTSTSSNVSFGSKPDFETIYKRPPSPPKK